MFSNKSSSTNKTVRDEPRQEYESAQFKQSRISDSTVKLIKVPKFVADSWKSADDHSVVALLSTVSEDQNELILQPNTGVNSAVSKITRLRGTLVNKNPGLHILCGNSDGRYPVDVAASVKESVTFAADVSTSYRNFLRQKHLKRDVNRDRCTVEESRPEAGLDERNTLFQYYQQGSTKEDFLDGTSDGPKRLAAFGVSASRPKAKGRKHATLSEDELKIRLFSMFEEAGDEGLMLKQIVMATDQPQCFVKNVVDEIAEPGRRKSDKRMAYFVKNHFNPNAVLPDEAPLKKPRL